jgi:exonuclease SbcC
MTDARLGSLNIENFRSIKGVVSVPLDAPIVLLHGSNGMGKTSILSALELALTGQIEHLQRIDPKYAVHLLRRGCKKGSINLEQAGNIKSSNFSGSIQITSSGKSGKNLLPAKEAKFFSERCYLPQSALGRLLELYQNTDTNEKASPLTKFVNDLLGLDQLDAIVDGLHPGLHAARVRNLVPEIRRLESVKSTLEDNLDSDRASEAELNAEISKARKPIFNLLSALYPPKEAMEELVDRPSELKKKIEKDSEEDKKIARLTRARQELTSLNQRWSRIPRTAASTNRQDKEQAYKKARTEYENWLKGPGSELSTVAKTLSDIFPSLPPLANADPISVRSAIANQVRGERERCLQVLRQSAEASERVKAIAKTIAGSKARLSNIEAELKTLAGDSEDLAHALSSIIPHIHDENCPVCNRDFSETRKKSLSTHVAASIAALTRQAGKLRSYVQERTLETGRVKEAEQELLAARKGLIAVKQLSDLTVRKVRLDDASQKLATLSGSVASGGALLKRQSAAREELAQSSLGDELNSEIRSETEKWIETLRGRSLEQFNTIGQALVALITDVNSQLREIQEKQTHRLQLISLLTQQIERVNELRGIAKRRSESEKEAVAMKVTSRNVEIVRSEAKDISNAASYARAAIVGRVFNTSLNKMWRDLFVRLAPNEQFVPAFKLPEGGNRAIEASLETIHRTDRSGGGPPGTMLSAGNLNTAALTLFLALHLSVARRIPWLILDDPVQSMDDVHISQFAALLRMISKGLDRQIILAVHDRALFEYLTLELSPAFENDRLMTIELSRTTDGDSIATPRLLTFKPDRAIAA